MASVEQIATLATAGSTVILSVATFASVRSATRTARAAESSLMVGTRPVLITSREEDPPVRVGFGDDVVLRVPGHGAGAEARDGRIYMALALRNGGAGLAVLHGWRAKATVVRSTPEMPDPDDFRRQQRDLYIPPGELGFWQGAVRDREDPDHAELLQAVESDSRIEIDLLYGDMFGGQRTIVRIGMSTSEDLDARRAEVGRYWNVDGEQAR